MAQATIPLPRIGEVSINIAGTAPFVSNKFAAEAREMMRAKQEAGSTAKKGVKREAKDFESLADQSAHRLPDGGYGIPATAFRQAMISACRLVGFKMTLAKLSLFIKADGFDADPGERVPLVKIEGEARTFEMATRNATGVADIRARKIWDSWKSTLRVAFDEDQFTSQDVVNLITRVGMQVGIGAGRPDSKDSCGQGWGTFEIVDWKYTPSKTTVVK